MKNLPKTIYLQIGEEATPEDDFKEGDGYTWSSERVYDTDIEYFRKKKLIPEEIPEFHASIAAMPQEAKDRVDHFATSVNSADASGNISNTPTLYVKERATGKVLPVWKYSGTQGFDANWVNVYDGKEPRILIVAEKDSVFEGETIPCCSWFIPSGATDNREREKRIAVGFAKWCKINVVGIVEYHNTYDYWLTTPEYTELIKSLEK